MEPLVTPTTEPEEREWVIWGGPCWACGSIICDCPNYRPFEGGMTERTLRALRLQEIQDNLLGFNPSLSGVRMRFDDIKGKCPICSQGPAGMTVNVESPSLSEQVKVRCNNNHWSTLEEWNRPPQVAAPVLPPARETATMIQNPEPEPDPLAPVKFIIEVVASRSALELVGADFNPTKSIAIGRMKQHVAGVISLTEQIRDKEAGPSARLCNMAITKFEEGAMILEKALRLIKEP